MRALAIAVLLVAAGFPVVVRAQDACDLDTDCDVAPIPGNQDCSFDVRQTLEKAANHALVDAPAMPAIRRGCAGNIVVPGRVPCQLFKAFTWAKSGWRQFCTTGCGAEGGLGPTRLGATCGVGLTQVPENDLPDDVDILRVAASDDYNAGAGARRLADAWGRTPCVGDADPDKAEHWYFAVWAADVFTFINNPNNPAYPVMRGVYGDSSGFDRDSYPFQEVVFGLAANPPLDDDGESVWQISPVNLPSTIDICGTAGCIPGNIDSPPQTHPRLCPPFNPPTDGGTDDAGPDASEPDAGVDAGNLTPDRKTPGCGCDVASRNEDASWTVALLFAALLWQRSRSAPARRAR